MLLRCRLTYKIPWSPVPTVHHPSFEPAQARRRSSATFTRTNLAPSWNQRAYHSIRRWKVYWIHDRRNIQNWSARVWPIDIWLRGSIIKTEKFLQMAAWVWDFWHGDGRQHARREFVWHKLQVSSGVAGVSAGLGHIGMISESWTAVTWESMKDQFREID